MFYSSLTMKLKIRIICLLRITILNSYLCEIASKKIALFKIMGFTACLSVECLCGSVSNLIA